MNKENNSALVPKTPVAIEKAESDAKRVLSGMVSDTLALAKIELPRKAVFSVLTCIGDEDFSNAVKEMIQTHLAKTHDVSVTERFHAADIIEFVQQQPVDLIAAMVNNILIPNTAGENRLLKAAELLGHLKAQYGVPVIAFSPFIPEFVDLVEALKQNRIDTFFPAPFDTKEFQKALDYCLNGEATRSIKPGKILPQSRRTNPLRIVMVDVEPGPLQFFEHVIRHGFKNVTLLSFNSVASALKELSQTDPDLLITRDRMPRISGIELCQHLLNRRVSYPIIVFSGWKPTEEIEQLLREFVRQGLNVSLLSVPCDVESMFQAVESALKIRGAQD